MLDDDQSDMPLFVVSSLLLRLDQDENFASDLGDWHDEKLQLKAGKASPGT